AEGGRRPRGAGERLRRWQTADVPTRELEGEDAFDRRRETCDQNALMSERTSRSGGCLIRRAKPQSDAEDGAEPGLALDGDGSIHRLNQAPRDGEAQTRASIPPVVRRFRLVERLEDPLALFGADADTAVEDFEADLQPAVRLDRLEPERNSTLFGELHCIGQQVDHDLPEPGAVSVHPARGSRSDAQSDFEPFGCTVRRHQLERALERVGEREDVLGELQRSALHAGQVENLVDELEEALAARSNEHGKFLLLRSER